jgi:hypothetical protein
MRGLKKEKGRNFREQVQRNALCIVLLLNQFFFLLLFRIPHMPTAGSLKVLRAPARQRGILRASQTKIYNLETDDFVSNLPFSK